MPPKRKQPEDSAPEGATNTRSTRASTRSSTSAAKNTSKGTGKKAAGKVSARSAAAASSTNEGDDGADSETMDVAPPAKRARPTGGLSPRVRSAATKAAPQTSGQRGTSAMKIDGEPQAARKVSSIKEYASPLSKSKSSINVDNTAPTTPSQAKITKKTTKTEPYSAQRALELFSTYADADDANVIGPEGFEQLCTDASIPMDGSCPLILAWLMGAKEMAKISKEEWSNGTQALKVASVSQLALAVTELEQVLIEDKSPIKPTVKKDQEYDRAQYFTYVSKPKSAFQKLYVFSFALAKPEQSRNIDMETSIAFWTVLLVPKYPIMADVIRFITEKGTYKATNKDLWSMMLEFCETVKPDLQDYEADGAWPTLLDDFVIWKKGQTSNGSPDKMDDSQ